MRIQKATLKKRKNPKTGKPFVYGETDEKGNFFVRYLHSPQKKNPEFLTERWEEKPERFYNLRINVVLGNIRKRVKNKSIPFNVDAKYLLSIFPYNMICPILGIEMSWGGNSTNSPSLDRLNPSKGYIKGNVRWVSNKANVLKNENNFEDFEKIYFDMKKLREKNLI